MQRVSPYFPSTFHYILWRLAVVSAAFVLLKRSTMTVEEFARTVLFGTRLEDKLSLFDPLNLGQTLDTPPSPPRALGLNEVPQFPGRPDSISRAGKATFPSLHKLRDPKARGEMLHFFANHELLAMELMALVLLRFPEAPAAFRLGLVRTIQEEQSHLKLYLGRMKELGVELGELPVSNYFWTSMSGISSPLDFVVQMSLTFEQANLDFSRYYMHAVSALGDDQTAKILERVYREEIGHVKHGLSWFNRWRENPETESDWDAYLRLLPPPMTASRAKGLGFCADVRRQAGFSETFIRELSIFSGSKGRPPVIWFYNPHCDAEIARGTPGYNGTLGAQRISEDLEAIQTFLASDKDVVLVKKRPSTEWIQTLQAAGVQTPEFVEQKRETLHENVRALKVGGLEPWGWSPDSFEAFKPLRERLVDMTGANSKWSSQLLSHESFKKTELSEIFSKSWSTRFFKDWLKLHPEATPHFGKTELLGETFTTWLDVKTNINEILKQSALMSQNHFVMIKAPYGTSGMQVRKVQNMQELEGPLGGWIKNILKQQSGIVVETFLNKICDLSMQLTIEEDRTLLFEVRRFITGNRNDYRGSYVGKKLVGLSGEEVRFLHDCMPAWQQLARDLATRLRQLNYLGPAGIDALLWRTSEGELKLKPLVELNPRWTMGRVAHSIEELILPGTSGIWAFLSITEVKRQGYSSTADFVEEIKQKFPLKMIPAAGGVRMESGVLFTNDPAQAQEVLTVLATVPNPVIEGFWAKDFGQTARPDSLQERPPIK